MLTNIDSSVVRNAYQTTGSELQGNEVGKKQNVGSQQPLSRVEELKTQVQNGELKVDIDALANKIADEFLGEY